MKSTRNGSRLADQGTKEMLPVIFSLAWPTMLEQLMQTAVQYMDTGMVGVLGTSATAAVGATSTVNWLFKKQAVPFIMDFYPELEVRFLRSA